MNIDRRTMLGGLAGLGLSALSPKWLDGNDKSMTKKRIFLATESLKIIEHFQIYSVLWQQNLLVYQFKLVNEAVSPLEHWHYGPQAYEHVKLFTAAVDSALPNVCVVGFHSESFDQYENMRVDYPYYQYDYDKPEVRLEFDCQYKYIKIVMKYDFKHHGMIDWPFDEKGVLKHMGDDIDMQVYVIHRPEPKIHVYENHA